MAPQSSRVTILGDEYPIKGDVDNSTTMKVVEYVNQKIGEVRGGSASQDKLKIAILTALNIAGELFEYRSKDTSAGRSTSNLEKRVQRLAAKIDEVLK